MKASQTIIRSLQSQICASLRVGKLGWQAVPILNGDGLSTWESLEAVHFKKKPEFGCGDDIPYEISCQSLITWKGIPNCLAKNLWLG